MQHVSSADGTRIAFEELGQGPAVVLVGGAFCDRRARVSGLPLARALAPGLRVLVYDRRGRGDSTDTPPYAVERELEDLAAVLTAAGGRAHVYGHSSGAILALEAALLGLPIAKLSLYEPPLVLGGTRERMPADLPEQLDRLIAEGKRTEVTELFLTRGVGLPPSVVEQRKQGAGWASLEALAHTLSYDARLTADPDGILARAARLTNPTALFAGGKSQPWMRSAAESLARVVPGIHFATLPDQSHDVDPLALAPKLLDFFLA